MDNSRRWFAVFASIIALLVLVSVVLVFISEGREARLLPADTPQGIVQRYLIALQKRDYQQAYGYLHFESTEHKPTYDDWLRMTAGITSRADQPAWKASLGSITPDDSKAVVEVIIDTFRPGGPFVNPVTTQVVNFSLIETDFGWLITSPTYVYWIY